MNLRAAILETATLTLFVMGMIFLLIGGAQ